MKSFNKYGEILSSFGELQASRRRAVFASVGDLTVPLLAICANSHPQHQALSYCQGLMRDQPVSKQCGVFYDCKGLIVLLVVDCARPITRINATSILLASRPMIFFRGCLHHEVFQVSTFKTISPSRSTIASMACSRKRGVPGDLTVRISSAVGQRWTNCRGRKSRKR